MGWLDSIKKGLEKVVDTVKEGAEKVVDTVKEGVEKVGEFVSEHLGGSELPPPTPPSSTIPNVNQSEIDYVYNKIVSNLGKGGSSGGSSSSKGGWKSSSSGGSSGKSSGGSSGGGGAGGGSTWWSSGGGGGSIISGGGGGGRNRKNIEKLLQQTLEKGAMISQALGIKPPKKYQSKELDFIMTIAGTKNPEDVIIKSIGKTPAYANVQMYEQEYNVIDQYLQVAQNIKSAQDELTKLQSEKSKIREYKKQLSEYEKQLEISKKNAEEIVKLVNQHPELLRNPKAKQVYEQAKQFLANYSKYKQQLEQSKQKLNEYEQRLTFTETEINKFISQGREWLRKNALTFYEAKETITKPPSPSEWANWWLGKAMTELFGTGKGGTKIEGKLGEFMGFLKGGVEVFAIAPAAGIISVASGIENKLEGGSFIEALKESWSAYERGKEQARVSEEFRKGEKIGELFGMGMSALEIGAGIMSSIRGTKIVTETTTFKIPETPKVSGTFVVKPEEDVIRAIGGYEIKVPFVEQTITKEVTMPGKLGRLLGRTPKAKVVGIESKAGVIEESGFMRILQSDNLFGYESTGTAEEKIYNVMKFGEKKKWLGLKTEYELKYGPWPYPWEKWATSSKGFGKIEELINVPVFEKKGSRAYSKLEKAFGYSTEGKFNLYTASITHEGKLFVPLKAGEFGEIEEIAKTWFKTVGEVQDFESFNLNLVKSEGEITTFKLTPKEEKEVEIIIKPKGKGKVKPKAPKGEGKIKALVDNLGANKFVEQMETSVSEFSKAIEGALSRQVERLMTNLLGKGGTVVKAVEKSSEGVLLRGLGGIIGGTASLTVSKGKMRQGRKMSQIISASFFKGFKFSTITGESFKNMLKNTEGMFNLEGFKMSLGQLEKFGLLEGQLEGSLLKTLELTKPKLPTPTPTIPVMPPIRPPKLPNIFKGRKKLKLGGGGDIWPKFAWGWPKGKKKSLFDMLAWRDLLSMSKSKKKFLSGKDILKINIFRSG